LGGLSAGAAFVSCRLVLNPGEIHAPAKPSPAHNLGSGDLTASAIPKKGKRSTGCVARFERAARRKDEPPRLLLVGFRPGKSYLIGLFLRLPPLLPAAPLRSIIAPATRPSVLIRMAFFDFRGQPSWGFSLQDLLGISRRLADAWPL